MQCYNWGFLKQLLIAGGFAWWAWVGQLPHRLAEVPQVAQLVLVDLAAVAVVVAVVVVAAAAVVEAWACVAAAAGAY